MFSPTSTPQNSSSFQPTCSALKLSFHVELSLAPTKTISSFLNTKLTFAHSTSGVAFGGTGTLETKANTLLRGKQLALYLFGRKSTFLHQGGYRCYCTISGNGSHFVRWRAWDLLLRRLLHIADTARTALQVSCAPQLRGRPREPGSGPRGCRLHDVAKDASPLLVLPDDARQEYRPSGGDLRALAFRFLVRLRHPFPGRAPAVHTSVVRLTGSPASFDVFISHQW